MDTNYRVRWFAVIGLTLALVPGGAMWAGPQVAEPFRAYYAQHEGLRVLGYPLTGLVEADGYSAQYFEKGRLEDHRADAVEADWAIMYGRLSAELIERGGHTTVSGTTLTYGVLQRQAAPTGRHPAPAELVAGVVETRLACSCRMMPSSAPPTAISSHTNSGTTSRAKICSQRAGCTTSGCR